MPKLLVFDEQAVSGCTWIRKLKDQSAGAGIQIQQATTVEGLQTALNRRTADVILVDVSGDRASRAEFLVAVQAQHPDMRALVVVDPEIPQSEALQSLLVSPSIDFVRAPADSHEIWQRIGRLARSGAATEGGAAISKRVRVRKHRSRRGGLRAAIGAGAPRNPTTGGKVRHLVPHLRNPNGRLDAKRVSEFFGLPLTEVARIVGRQPSTVHKTPAAPSLQPGLGLFERIAVALLPLAGSVEGLRMWMNAPNPDLDGHSPIELLTRGQGEIVAELLEDALVGQPG